jgi:hypothetical protein
MRRAQDLVDGLLSEPWGSVSPSVYETARVVALAPWLKGHAERVEYLIETQRPDGRWGPDHHPGYALVPTLSSVEALLEQRSRSTVPRSLSSRINGIRCRSCRRARTTIPTPTALSRSGR